MITGVLAGVDAVQFASPGWLLAIPVLLAGAVWSRFGRPHGGHAALAVPQLGSRRWTLRLLLAWVPGVLKLVGLILVVMALARPQSVRVQEHRSYGLDLMVAVDVSNSMGDPALHDTLPMVDRAKNRILAFSRARPADRFGLVVFGNAAHTILPPGAKRSTFEAAVGSLQWGDYGSLTATGHGIALAAKRLQDSGSTSRAIVLITDGTPNAEDDWPVGKALAVTSALGIPVHVLAIQRAPAYAKIRSMAAFRELEPLVLAAGGTFTRVKNDTDLGSALASLDELQPSPGITWSSRHPTDRYRWPLLPGMVLLAASTVLSTTWLRRGP